MKVGKKGKIGGAEGAFVGAIVVVIAFVAFYMFMGPGAAPQTLVGGVDEDTGEVIASCKCTGGDTQSFDPNAYNMETGAALTEASNVYYLSGSPAPLLWTQGTAITGLDTCEDYEFAIGPDTTVGDQYDVSYGPWFIVEDLPCVKTINLPLFADELEGSLTAVFLDEYGQPDEASPVAGTDLTVGIQWYAGSKEYYGNPWIGQPDYLDVDWNSMTSIKGINFKKGTSANSINGNRPKYPNIICFDYNVTTWDDIDWVYANLQDGSREKMNQVSTPRTHTVDSTGDSVKCFEAPVITSDAVTFDVRLDPDDTTAATTDDITASLYAGSWGLHTDDLSVIWGVEDNDGNNLGASDEDTLDLDFTA